MDRRTQAFDIVVVGAGPAGIAAASLAAEAGRKVAILDSSSWLGGQIWRGPQTSGKPRVAHRWLDRLRASGAEVFSGATVFATGSDGAILAETTKEVLSIGWKKLIIATGAREVFLPFPGWTLPGVMGPGGLHAMVKEGWPVTGKRVVVAGTGPLLFAAAEGLRGHGAVIPLIAEQTSRRKIFAFAWPLFQYPGKLLQAVKTKAALLGVPYRCGCWPVSAAGNEHVQSVTLTDGGRTWTEPCDYLACGFHLAPNLELPQLLGCTLAHGSVKVDDLQETSIANVFCAGEPTGIGGVECALVEGQIAGLAAAGCTDSARQLLRQRKRWLHFKDMLAQAFGLTPPLRRLANDQTIFCRCEDIRYGDIAGFGNWRAARLLTRCGMGACQGRTCGTAARFLFGWEPASVRPPIFPVRSRSLALAATFDPGTHNSNSSQ